MRRAVAVPLSVLLLAAAMPSVGADELRLRDGRVLDGEVRPGARPDTFDVVTGAEGFTATVHIHADDIVSRTPGDTPRQAQLRVLDAERLALAEGGSAADWWRLAAAYRAIDEALAARVCLRAVVAREPDHAEARAALGQVRHDDRWLSPSAAALARGEVLFRGRWLPEAQRDAILADETAEAERVAAESTRRHERNLQAIEESRRRAAARPPPPPPASAVFLMTPMPLFHRPCPRTSLRFGLEYRGWRFGVGQ